MSNLRNRIMIGCSIVLLAVLVPSIIFHRHIATAYVAWRFESAQSSSEELAAASLMNRWAHLWTHGYAIETEDAQGNAIRPEQTGDYEAVVTVTVTWDNGMRARRQILDTDSLSLVFGE